MFNYNTDVTLWENYRLAYPEKIPQIVDGHVFCDGECLARFDDDKQAADALILAGYPIETP